MTTTLQKPCPEEAQALCFAMTGHITGVARVARLAQNRLVQGGFAGWKITGVEIVPDVGELDALQIHLEPIGHYAEPRAIAFVRDVRGIRSSQRFVALVRAAGVRDWVGRDEDLVGRYLAIRQRGLSPSDFADYSEVMA